MITKFQLRFNKAARARYGRLKAEALEYGRSVFLDDSETLDCFNIPCLSNGATIAQAVARNGIDDDEFLAGEIKSLLCQAEFRKSAPNRIQSQLIQNVCAMAADWSKKGHDLQGEIAAILCTPDRHSLRGDSPLNFVTKNEQFFDSRLSIATDVCEDRLKAMADLGMTLAFPDNGDPAVQNQARLIRETFEARDKIFGPAAMPDKVIAQILTSRRIMAMHGESPLSYCQPSDRRLQDSINLVRLAMDDYTAKEYEPLVQGRALPENFDDRREVLSGLVRDHAKRVHQLAYHA